MQAPSHTSHMEPFYIAVFGVLAALAAALELTKSKSTSTDNSSRDFSRFRSNYVLVYSLMMGASVSGQNDKLSSVEPCHTPHVNFSCIEDPNMLGWMAGCQRITRVASLPVLGCLHQVLESRVY